MSNYTYGFIGTGNMGSALARAVAASESGNILLSNRTPEKAENLAKTLSAEHPCIAVQCVENGGIAAKCKYIFLGVKPQMMSDMLREIAPILKSRTDRFILVSMAAGLRSETLREMAGVDCPIIRLMPNTPVSIGEGVVLYAADSVVAPDELQTLLDALAPAGTLTTLPENLFDAGSALSGCGPAFADLFLEALADGGVRCGLPRQIALTLAEQMLIGSAKLALATGNHPGALKDAVCSPAGSTIEGVARLENGAFRGTVSDAVVAAYKRNGELGKG